MATAREDESTSTIRDTGKTWRKVTFSVIVPYRSDWVTEPIESSHGRPSKDETNKFFKPLINHESHENFKGLQTALKYANSQGSYFFSKRIKAAVNISHYAFYGHEDKEKVLSEIREAEYLSDGCKIPQNLRYVGLERREYDDLLGSVAGGEAFCYAVLHFLIDDATDIEVAEVAEWLKRPKWYGEKYLTSLLDNAGIGKCKYSKGGFSCEKKNWDEPEQNKRHNSDSRSNPSFNYNRIFVLTFAEVDPCGLKRPSCFDHHESWTPTQAWLYELATGGIGIYSGMPPSDTSDAARDGMFCFGATWGRIEESGIALLAQPVLCEEANLIHAVKLCLLCHSRMLDIIILCLRQRIYLDRNAESEARVLAGKSRWGDEEFAQLLDREQSVAAFLNGLWFTEVPGRREATLVMKEFQKVLGTPALLTELRDEQESLVRVVEVQRRIDNVAREKNRKEQERRREEREKDAENKLEIIVLCLTVISTVLALAALFSDPSILLCIVGFAIAAILAAIATVVVREKQKSVTRNPKKETK